MSNTFTLDKRLLAILKEWHDKSGIYTRANTAIDKFALDILLGDGEALEKILSSERIDRDNGEHKNIYVALIYRDLALWTKARDHSDVKKMIEGKIISLFNLWFRNVDYQAIKEKLSNLDMAAENMDEIKGAFPMFSRLKDEHPIFELLENFCIHLKFESLQKP